MAFRRFARSCLGIFGTSEFPRSPFGSGPRYSSGNPLNDWLAVISLGTYPTPTPSDAERAYYAATLGLRHTL